MLVAEFARGGGSAADTHVFRVVKGVPAASASAASDPVLTQDNLASGGNKRQEALYRINVNGLSIESIERVAPYVGSFYV